MTEYIIFIPLIILTLGLTPVVLLDSYIRKEQKNTMIIIIALICLLLFQNYEEYQLKTFYSMPFLRMIFSVVGYSVRPFIIVLFGKLVSPERKRYIAWILAVVNTLIYSMAIFTPEPFYISEENHFIRGHIGYTAYLISAILLINLVGSTLYKYRENKEWFWITIANAGIIVASVVMELTPLYHDYPVTYSTIAIVCCSLFYYIWLHLEFVREHEKALMAEQRIKIMMSQIQPHFLYNTLSTIQALCLTDPQKAFETTEEFGTYLRRNIDFLDQPNLINLNKELEHTRIYSEIERLRFPKISVEYDIKAEDFFVPALTIQPLVENAIRHGVRSRKQGLVTVATSEKNDFYQIVISDNGIGFEPDKIDSLEGSHIGISNVRERIEKMCGGELVIDSRIGEGTSITIKVPKNSGDEK